VAKREQELQGTEEEITSKLEHERCELTSRTIDLRAHEATLKMEQEHLRKTRDDLYNHELTISSQEGILEHRAIALTFKERELAGREKRLAEKEL
jgi:hypothetical protein